MKKSDYRKMMLTSLFVMMSLFAVAASVSLQEAQTRASAFLLSRQSGRMAPARYISSPELLHAVYSAFDASAIDYYVFYSGDADKFVIVTGDDRARNILGYGEGRLDMNDLPCNMQCLLDQYREQLDWLTAHPAAQVESNPRPVQSENDVMPLLTSHWSQSEPYNHLCPTDTAGNHVVAGCIATAMAQVMYYWRFPNQLPAVAGYGCNSFELEDLPPCTLSWDNMLDQYLGRYDDNQVTAVATLMRYCGQACHVEYGVDGSGSYLSNQRGALISFGYSSGIGSKSKDWYSISSWTSQMLDELHAGRPILYTAQSNGSGHAFVIDGWYDGMFHINWGWAGTGNGYFALDAFNVEEYSFNSHQTMLTNVYPGMSGFLPEEDYDVLMDGIYYKLSGREAMVVSKDSRHNSYTGDVIIPDHIVHEGKSHMVTAIGDGAFMDCAGLNRVVIPATVTTIGKQAFRNCSGLPRVSLPDHVTFIGEQAFAHCVSLELVTIPSSVQVMDYDAFEGCVGLRRVFIRNAASWCAIHFSNNNSNPLYHARRLYLNTKEMTTLVIPGTVTAVSRSAFINCTSIRELVVEEGVQSLERASFCYCDNLASVTLPSTLTAIGQSAFYECTSLSRLALPQGLLSIGPAAFYGCAALTGLTIPDKVQTVGDAAFNKCSVMKYIVFGESLMSIGENICDGCNGLDSLVIGSRVKSIGSMAFNSCRDLTTVTCRALAVPQLASQDCFSDETYTNATLQVPSRVEKDYREADFWKNFVNIVGVEIHHDLPGDVNGDGSVNIADINALIGAILSGYGSAVYDVNSDGSVNITDINAVINWILNN